MKKIGIIFNTNAGSFRSLLDNPRSLINEIFQRNHIEDCDIDVKPVEGKDITKTVQKMIADDFDIIVAAGGDGTINSIATLIKDSDAALGVIPMGTFNHFAKDTGIPLDLEGALLNLFFGEISLVDYGTVNEKVFLNNSSLGYYPIAVLERDKEKSQGKLHRKMQMAYAFLKTAIRFPLLEVQTEDKNHKNTITTSIIFIGNNHYNISPFAIGQRSRLTEGILSGYASTCTNIPCAITLAFLTLTNTLALSEKFRRLTFTEGKITSKKTLLNVAIDGEVYKLPPPLHYKMYPRALKVILPQQETNSHKN